MMYIMSFEFVLSNQQSLYGSLDIGSRIGQPWSSNAFHIYMSFIILKEQYKSSTKAINFLHYKRASSTIPKDFAKFYIVPRIVLVALASMPR